MEKYTKIGLKNWSRKSTFEYFRRFELPFFNMTATVDVTALKSLCQKENLSFFLASNFMAMHAANAIPEFRMRIVGEDVLEFEQTSVGSTIQYEDQSFGFCYFPYLRSLTEFQHTGKSLLEKSLSSKAFSPNDGNIDLMHLSVIPWLHFSSFQHARRIAKDDSIPKLVFGKYQRQGDALLMPVNVEVHHALVDGFHVGQFFRTFQSLLDKPHQKL